MKTKIQRLLVALMTLSAVHHAAAQGTAFTYQGQLQNNGGPASGTYDFTFSLYNAAGGGSVIAGPVNTNGVIVTNGLFQVTLDFGASVWNSATNWLQISVATNGSTTITYLAPLQQITPVPQAIYATTASNLLGTLPAGQLNGTVSPTQLPSTVVTQNEAAVTLGSLTVSGLELPSPIMITSDLGSLLYSDQAGNFAGGLFANVGSGSDNTVIGSRAEAGAGSGDTVVGYYAGDGGSYNTAVGWTAMYLASGNYNVAVGGGALYYGSGTENTAVGYQALNSQGAAMGSYNTTIGYQSLFENTIGSDNTACGIYAMYYNTSGSNNTATGDAALGANTTGDDNTADGDQALASIQQGSQNVAIGYEAFQSLQSGEANTAIGTMAGQKATTDMGIVAIGFEALQNDNAENAGSGSTYGENTAIGFEALEADSTGYGNTAIGWSALADNMVGVGNTAIGDAALTLNNGVYNVAVGSQALLANYTGIENTALGASSLQNNASGSHNTALGNRALFQSMGGGNIGIGNGGGDEITTGDNNIDIGNEGNSADSGIIRIGTPGTHSATYLAGTAYCQVLSITSDRNAKEDFAAIDPRDVLERVSSLPVTEWKYKTDAAGLKHIGPMAQDFQAAFGLNGADDTHISVVDEGGVALAAIQGLNQKLEDTRAENAELKRKNDSLAQQLNQLAEMVQGLADKK